MTAHQHPQPEPPRSAPPRRVPVLFGLGLACLAAFGAGDVPGTSPPRAGSGFDAVLLDHQLQARRVHLTAFDENVFTIGDESSKRSLAQTSTLAGMIAAPPGASSPQGIGAVGERQPLSISTIRRRLDAQKRGSIELTDGQRFPGDVAHSAGQKDAVVWTHPKFGDMTVPLERVAVMSRPIGDAASAPIATPEQPPVQDELILANGDRITGLVVDLGDPVRIETDDKVLEMPAERVAGALLSNPRSRAAGTVVWLDDGTIAAIRAMATRGEDRILITLPTGQSAEYELDALRGIAFDAQRLVPLSSLNPTAQSPVGDRLHAQPINRVQHPTDLGVGSAVTLGAWDLELPGPMRIEYSLPEGAQRLAMTASLAGDTAPWGDCTLIISNGTSELSRVHLHQQEPVHSINVPINDGSLTITLEPGAYGPIKDHVILRRPMLLLK